MSSTDVRNVNRLSWRSPAAAWALYDFAYSMFIFVLAIRIFPTWIIDDLHRPDWYVGATQFAAVLGAVVAMPFVGALADHLSRRKPFLFGFTVAACGTCAALGVLPTSGSILPVLVLASITVGFGQLAIAHFDPLLADVAGPEDRGRISGLAVALGFAGVAFGLAVVSELIVGEGNKQRAFLPVALLYFVFALPALALIREPRREAPKTPSATRAALSQVVVTLRSVGRHRAAFQFLFGRFLYSDAIVTVGAFLTVYMTRLGGFSEREKTLVLGAGVVTAAVGAVVAGRIVEAAGPKRPLLTVLPAVAFALLIAAVVGRPWTAWLISCAGGLAVGFIWTADRVFMLNLAPAPLRGQFFAFFNLANRIASAFAPVVIWGGTVWLLHQQTAWLSALNASRIAIAGLAGTALLGWFVIRPVPDHHTVPP